MSFVLSDVIPSLSNNLSFIYMFGQHNHVASKITHIDRDGKRSAPQFTGTDLLPYDPYSQINSKLGENLLSITRKQ